MLAAEEAVEWGLVNKSVKASDLMDEAGSLTEMLAAGTNGLWPDQRFAEWQFDKFTRAQMDQEARYRKFRTGSDGQAGIQAL